MLSLIAHFVASLGYLGVALLMAIENIVIPLPSELIMPLAGFLAGRGYMSLPGVIIAGSVGSVAGAIPVYWIARKVGEERVTEWIVSDARWLRIRARDIEAANARFKRHGRRSVFLSQLIPGLRVLISIPAGVAGMDLRWFIVTNLAGTFIWCGALAIAGEELGVHFSAVAHLMRPILWISTALAVAVLSVWAWRRSRRQRLA